MRPIVLGDPQPHVEVSLTPTSTDTRATASRLAPAQSTRPGDLIGDSGTHRHVANAAKMIARSGDQNSQWEEGLSAVTPASTMPAPPPMPMIVDINPIEPATRSR